MAQSTPGQDEKPLGKPKKPKKPKISGESRVCKNLEILLKSLVFLVFLVFPLVSAFPEPEWAGLAFVAGPGLARGGHGWPGQTWTGLDWTGLSGFKAAMMCRMNGVTLKAY